MKRWLLAGSIMIAAASHAWADNWYEESFWLLHEDHHTVGDAEVGGNASLEETSRLTKD